MAIAYRQAARPGESSITESGPVLGCAAFLSEVAVTRLAALEHGERRTCVHAVRSADTRMAAIRTALFTRGARIVFGPARNVRPAMTVGPCIEGGRGVATFRRGVCRWSAIASLERSTSHHADREQHPEDRRSQSDAPLHRSKRTQRHARRRLVTMARMILPDPRPDGLSLGSRSRRRETSERVRA